MSNKLVHEPDERRLAELLRLTEEDAAAPDTARLEAICAQAGDLFESHNDGQAAGLGGAGAATVMGGDVEKGQQSGKGSTSAIEAGRSPMVTFAFRGVAALVAVVSLITAWLVGVPDKVVQGGVPFARILEQVRQADTLQLRLVRDGRTVNFLVNRFGVVRRDESPQRYQISDGSKLWTIDEEVHSISVENGGRSRGADQQVDLLALLEVGVMDASKLLKAVPTRRMEYRGSDCDVYEGLVDDSRDGRLRIEAYTVRQTKQLAGIAAWPATGGVNENAGPPLAELQLVAVNPPVEEDKFDVSNAINEIGGIGKVEGAQGVVLVRPLKQERWTPVSQGMEIKPGDWVRTDLRGANAVKVTFSSEFELTLGPGSLLECISPTRGKMHSGGVQVQLAKANGKEYELLAPRTGARKFQAAGKTLVRVDKDEALVDVKQTPIWLAGFEGGNTQESLGSLLVNIDGRQEPLSVGYHKVNVEVRDQIARTTIEESFVNHTNRQLEGVFHFPLPQDASISGFAMWIGDELIEADVVERQRAREIFETIVRERRDPGLLEWAGGNLFKARVFPIEARSEKRVKITYTQVLPLRGNRYRYTYGLRSELLRTRPVRELSVTVSVNSAMTLKNVSCPTHPVRTQKSEHAGRVEFAAQEYVPNRDFEVVCEVDQQQSDVVVIPHRRGADGYFLMQITPPREDESVENAKKGGPRRLGPAYLPDGSPLKLVLLCDTSASMDSEKRKQQREFVMTVLSSLGPADRFQLAAADVATVWPFAEPVAATPENLAKVGKFLEDRVSLGWTDLTRAFSDVLQNTPADAQVIYVGDGIVTTGVTDPHAFVTQLRRIVLGDDPKLPQQKRGFHAVTVGNSFESVIVQGIASLNGGSARSIGGEQTPQGVALELLYELAKPGMRDIRVEFRGVKVAGVYPQRLPNIAAGTQQILVGRYLPEGKDQQGEVIVTGTRYGMPVRYASKINFREAEQGNGFIPRLWARGHLDKLLHESQTSAIRQQVIALSEEFQIITPYTSLLVLESDADRERFGVRRRSLSADGEDFFAVARPKAKPEAVQQQMSKAGAIRSLYRSKLLKEVLRMGRDATALQTLADAFARSPASSIEKPERPTKWVYEAPVPWLIRAMKKPGREAVSPALEWDMPMGGMGMGGMAAFGGGFGGAMGGGGLRRKIDLVEKEKIRAAERLGGLGSSADFNPLMDLIRETIAPESWTVTGGTGRIREFDTTLSVIIRSTQPRKTTPKEVDQLVAVESDGQTNSLEVIERIEPVVVEDPSHPTSYDRSQLLAVVGPMMRRWAVGSDLEFLPALIDLIQSSRYAGTNDSEFALDRKFSSEYARWLDRTIPELNLPSRLEWMTDRELNSSNWPAEAVELSNSLVRAGSLKLGTGGLEIKRKQRQISPFQAIEDHFEPELTLCSATSWLSRRIEFNRNVLISYCNMRERGVFSRGLQIGRIRRSFQHELNEFPLLADDFSEEPLHKVFPNLRATIQPAAGGKAAVKWLILTSDDGPGQIRVTVDTDRRVVLKVEMRLGEESRFEATYSDFVEVAGRWWSRKALAVDRESEYADEVTLEFRELTAEQYQQRMREELALREQIQFLSRTWPSVAMARQRAKAGTATAEDRLSLVFDAAQDRDYVVAGEELDALEKLSPGRVPAYRWLRMGLLESSGQMASLRKLILEEAGRLAAGPTHDDVSRVCFILDAFQQKFSQGEGREILKRLRPVFERHAELEMYAQRMGNSSTDEEINEEGSLLLQLAKASPWDAQQQISYAKFLASHKRGAESQVWLKQAVDRERTELAASPGKDTVKDELRRKRIYELLEAQKGREELLKFTAEWLKAAPDSIDACETRIKTLLHEGESEAAYRLAFGWLREGRGSTKLTNGQRIRLNVALNLLVSRGSKRTVPAIDDERLRELVETVRHFSRQTDGFEYARFVMEKFDSHQMDQGDMLRGEFLQRLQTQAAEIPARQVPWMLVCATSGPITLTMPIAGRRQLATNEFPVETYKSIAVTLRERWRKTTDPRDKEYLEEGLMRFIATERLRETEYLPFLREAASAGVAFRRRTRLLELLEELAKMPWRQTTEAEAFAALQELVNVSGLPSADRITGDLRLMEVDQLHRLVDRLLQGRVAHAEWAEFLRHPELTLTEFQLQARAVEQSRTARQELASRLGSEAARQPNSPLAPWLRMEQVRLNSLLKQDTKEAREECWRILGAEPRPLGLFNDPKTGMLVFAEDPASLLEGLLRERALQSLVRLILQQRNRGGEVDRLLKYVDAGCLLPEPQGLAWQEAKITLLMLLDRSDDLERALRQKIQVEDQAQGRDEAEQSARVLLAHLLAERGDLQGAIGILQSAEKRGEFTEEEYQILREWYLALGQKNDAVQMQRKRFERQPVEAQFRLLIDIKRNHGELAALEGIDIASVVSAYLQRKSVAPEGAVSELVNAYSEKRDERLLRNLPDVLLGQNAETAYSLLETIRGQLWNLNEMEGVAVQVLTRLQELRNSQTSPLELRTFDLLEAVVEDRRAQWSPKRDPHVKACVAALRRGLRQKLDPAEVVLITHFLQRLRPFEEDEISAERLRELRQLRDSLPIGRERLRVADRLGQSLSEVVSRRREALREMDSEFKKFTQGHPERFPVSERDLLDRYIGMFEEFGEFREAEAVLLGQLRVFEGDRSQAGWLQERLAKLYFVALSKDRNVSLTPGSGEALVKALASRMLSQLGTETEVERIRAELKNLQQVAQMAKILKWKIPFDLQQLIGKTIPTMIRRDPENNTQLVLGVEALISEQAGPKEALRYLVEQIEQFPTDLRLKSLNVEDELYQALANRLTESRSSLIDLNELEPRVLQLVLEELRGRLTGENHNGGISPTRCGELYNSNSKQFWRAKGDDFARAAKETLAEDPQSRLRRDEVVNLLESQLERRHDAIEVLEKAHRSGWLDEIGLLSLVRLLKEVQREVETLPLHPLAIAAQPGDVGRREEYLEACQRFGKKELLRAALNETKKQFRVEGKWTSEIAASLAGICLEAELPEQAVSLAREAMAVKQVSGMAQAEVGLTLKDPEQTLVLGLRAMGKLREAVDVALATTVLDPEKGNTPTYIEQALDGINDLTPLIRVLNEEAAKAGQDSPLLRKILGRMLQKQGHQGPAIVQFRLSLELQPYDRDVHTALIESLDAIKLPQEGTRQLLRQIDFDRSDLELYKKLAERLQKNPELGERAITSIIEAAPKETESHTAVAELRQKQNRWGEAIVHWQRVAELRELEPTGLLKLAEAQIHEKRWEEARRSLDKLTGTKWDPRFTDVAAKVEALRSQVPKPAKDRN